MFFTHPQQSVILYYAVIIQMLRHVVIFEIEEIGQILMSPTKHTV